MKEFDAPGSCLGRLLALGEWASTAPSSSRSETLGARQAWSQYQWPPTAQEPGMLVARLDRRPTRGSDGVSRSAWLHRRAERALRGRCRRSPAIP